MKVTWKLPDGEITAEVANGVNMMEAAVANNVPNVIGECPRRQAGSGLTGARAGLCCCWLAGLIATRKKPWRQLPGDRMG